MIPDRLYIRRLEIALLLALALPAAAIWLWPDWQPPAARQRTVAPQVYFRPFGTHASPAHAAIWSPAAIALPGAPQQLASNTNKHLIAPPLDVAMRSAPVSPAAGAGQDDYPASQHMAARRQWPLFQHYLDRNISHNRIVNAPELVRLAAPPVVGTLPFEITPSMLGQTLDLDYKHVDTSGLPLPEAPCSALLFLGFDETGQAVRVILEIPTGLPDLDAELVLQAWRIMARAPGNDHFRGGACHLHVLFPGRGNQGRTTDGRGFGLNRQERQAQQKRKFIGLE
jgi:hypothetical protein